jgi:hypothetical protein
VNTQSLSQKGRRDVTGWTCKHCCALLSENLLLIQSETVLSTTDCTSVSERIGLQGPATTSPSITGNFLPFLSDSEFRQPDFQLQEKSLSVFSGLSFSILSKIRAGKKQVFFDTFEKN